MKDETNEQELAHIKNEVHGNDRIVRVDMSQRMQKDRRTIKEMTHVSLNIQREYQVDEYQREQITKNAPQMINIQIEEMLDADHKKEVFSLRQPIGNVEEPQAKPQEIVQEEQKVEQKVEQKEVHPLPAFMAKHRLVEPLVEEEVSMEEPEESDSYAEELATPPASEIEDFAFPDFQRKVLKRQREILEETPKQEEIIEAEQWEEEDIEADELPFDWETFMREKQKTRLPKMDPFLQTQEDDIPLFQKQRGFSSQEEEEANGWQEPRFVNTRSENFQMEKEASDAFTRRQGDRYEYYEQREQGPIQKREYQAVDQLEEEPQAEVIPIEKRKWRMDDKTKASDRTRKGNWLSEHKFIFYTMLIVAVDIVLAILLHRQQSIFQSNDVNNITFYVCIIMKYAVILHLLITLYAAYRDKQKLLEEKR